MSEHSGGCAYYDGCGKSSRPCGYCETHCLCTYTRGDMARAWGEGHTTPQRLGPDECKCAARDQSECGCGEYGTNVVTPNPYRASLAADEGDRQ